MADNILTVDRDGSNIALAAKDVGAVLFPRNILTDPSGNDLTPLTDAQLRATPLAVAGTVDLGATSLAALKSVTVNGQVELGATSLAALESVTAVGPLTEAQLRAAAVPVAATAVDLGEQADSAASTDTGAASLIALVKRALQNWTTLLARVPAKGLATMAGSQPVVIASDQTLPLPTGAATETTLASLASVVKAEDSASADGDSGLVMLAQRRDTDATAVSADGDYGTLNMDEAGRLKVAVQPASHVAITGNITANGQTVFAKCERFSNLMAHCAGTFSNVNVAFEGSINSSNGSDGNWFAVQAIRSNANTIETTTGNLSAAPAYAWELSVNGLKWFRVRATAYTSGTQAWTFQPGTYATEPIPGAQISGTQPVSGTVTATVTGGTTLPVTPTQAFVNSAATTNATSTKASAGTVWSIVATNTNAAARYLKLYNKASAPTVGTDVPVLTIALPAGGLAQVNGGSNGLRFATGIAWALTVSAADSATDAVAASEIKVGIAYT